MAFERPPILTGNSGKDIANLRDYLFRMAGSLNPIANTSENTMVVGYNAAGQAVQKKESPGGGADIEQIRRNASELRDLIIKTANGVSDEITNRINGDAGLQAGLTEEIAARMQSDNGVISYADKKVEEYGSMFVAKSEFGTFQENITGTIETTARGVVDSYNYGSAIQSVQDGVSLLQNYYTSIEGEIRRGIVLDPSTNEYVTGIAISQNLQFTGECGPSDQHNPGDGNTYYYLSGGQTFGLYTSTGWQFWIDGAKVGWFDSQDGMLHVGTVYVEQRIVNGGYWEEKTEPVNGHQMFVINYIGG